MPLDGREDEGNEVDDDGGGDGTGEGIPMLNSPNSVTETLSAFLLPGGIDTGFCLELDACFDNGCDDEGIATLSSPISVMINTGISFFASSTFSAGLEPCFFFQLSHNELNDCSAFWRIGPGARWEEASANVLSVFGLRPDVALFGASLFSKGKILSPAIHGTGTHSAICAIVTVVKRAVDFILRLDVDVEKMELQGRRLTL